MWMDFGWTEILVLLSGICCFSLIILILVVALVLVFNVKNNADQK
jgi:hypothetical protein